MCGICGIYDLSGQGRSGLAAVRAMSAAIQHRGPDGDGFYAPSAQPNLAMGMRRLSIIDVAGSDQPLYNEDRSIALVFNGEIYNYKELRRTLMQQEHNFRTQGDGETIIHLYEQYGLDLFTHLRGMYGFALWDSARERLVLAVDHIGMKPLYLSEYNGVLRFGSEVKALLADPEHPRELNLETLDTYMSFGYMIGEETLFKGIRRLPPGHALVAENGATHLHEFWRFGSDRIGVVGTRDYEGEAPIIEDARKLIAESVSLHLRTDVPFGLFLSGGVDSASVLAQMAQEVDGRIKTFTVGYDMESPDNELLQARRIAEHFKTDHHERIISAADWWRGFEQYVYAHDEPNANSSAVSLLLLAEDTAKQVKVVLTGLGGDELFGGYSLHHTLAWILRTRQTWGGLLKPLKGIFGAAEPHYPAMKRFRGIGALPTYLPRFYQAALKGEDGLRRAQSYDGMVFSDTLRAKLYCPELKRAGSFGYKERAYAEIVARSLRGNPDDTAQSLVINTWLTGNALLNCDKVTMAHSLEARVPFFDPALLEFAASVPPEIRMRRNKYVLREAMRPLLPDFALERPKKPFETPILGWFAGALRGNIEAALLDHNAYIRALFERPALETLLRDHFSGRAPQVEVVFRLLTLEMWAQKFRVGTPHFSPMAT
ncbi:MAG: asparagine synthase (glutamine-hydrolyzing) [Chloroflexota bacterium]